MSLRPRGHLRSRDKLKTNYFFLQKTYGHQALQGVDLWWGQPKMKLHDYLITWSQGIMCQIENIIYPLLQATKLGRVVTYDYRKPAME